MNQIKIKVKAITLMWLSLLVFPMPAQAFIHSLSLEIETGQDDLRGGQNNLDAIVLLRNGEQLRFENINQSQQWQNGSINEVRLNLTRWTDTNINRVSEIAGVLLSTHSGNGLSADNWDMKTLNITPLEYQLDRADEGLMALETIFQGRRSGGRPLWRFRGNSPLYRANFSQTYSHLLLSVKVGEDDLRQDNHLDLVVHFRGGQQYFSHLNDNENVVNPDADWSTGSFHNITLPLNRYVRHGDILGFTLTTSSRGGFGGDDFDMQSLRILAAGLLTGVVNDCFEVEANPLKRFTGGDWSYEAPCRW